MARSIAVYAPIAPLEIDVEETPVKRKRASSTTPRKKKEKAPQDFFLHVSPEDADLRLNYPNAKMLSNDRVLAPDNSNPNLLCVVDGKVAVDTETTGLRYRFGDMPWMVSMADSKYASWCGLWAVDPFTRRVLWEENEFWAYLKSVVEDPHIVKTYFNRWFDIRMLKQIGIEHKGESHDVSLMARVYNTDEFGYKLKPLMRKYCGLSSDDEEELKKGVQKLQRRARKAGWKVFNAEESTNSKAKDDKAAPDYWLTMYAHVLFPEDPEFCQTIKSLAEEYCRKDTLRTIVGDQFYEKKFNAEPAYQRSYSLEQSLSVLVDEMETRGIRTYKPKTVEDREYCLKKSEELLAEIQMEVGSEHHSEAEPFDPESPAKYSKYLFTPSPHGLGLPPTELTKGGQHKTGYKEIAHLAWHPFIQKVTAYKAHEKAVTLFFDKYLDNIIHDEEGDYDYLNPEINQGNTKTFRFSMSNPNLQQAANPETSARGANVIPVRGSFGPRPGYEWWLFDYSGQELRLLGGLMQIPAILDAVRNGDDIPTVMGNETWGGRNNPAAIEQAIEDLELNRSEPTSKEVAGFWRKIEWYPGKTQDRVKKQIVAEGALALYDYKIVKLEKALGKKVVRTRTKMCLYGKAFGAGPKGLVGLLLCDILDAKKWLNKLDQQFPRMKTVGNEWSAFAAKNGFITNAYGRRLTVDPEFSYRATNYRIQGSAAEMMKISMLRCNEYLKSTGLDAHVILTVHDELIFEINKRHTFPWLMRGIARLMEDHDKFVHIPMSVGVSRVVERWDQETGYEFDVKGNLVREGK